MNLLFSKGGRYTSTGMRGGQISYGLTGGYNNLIFNDINTFNKTIVFIKDDILNVNLLEILKSKNNKIILDVIDLLDTTKYNSQNNINSPNFFPDLPTEFIDGYIVNSFKMKNWWYGNIDKKPIFVIPHHWEQDFSLLKEKEFVNKPYFYYLGYVGHENQNCLYIEKLLEENHIDEHRFDTTNEGYYTNKPVDGCQLNIRNISSWEYCFKPATKLSVASAMDSLIITTNDWAVQDLLPSNYPYLLNSTGYNDVVNMINRVKENLKSKEWFLAKEMLYEVKNQTSLDNILLKYQEIDKFYV